MRAVWSFWSLPHAAHRRAHWVSDHHHLFSWILSVNTARRHFRDLVLYTDDDGARLLADRLQLPFTHVSTALNCLHNQDPDWWMLGKLYAYGVQPEPFVHMDSDVYLWKPLPLRVASAPVFAQSPEDAGNGMPWYDAATCEAAIRSHGEGSVPPEWIWYRTSGCPQEAACCGILGGNNVEFFQRYAATVIALLENPRNRAAFAELGDKKLYNPLFEQYLLCACARYHGVRIEYLFESFVQAISPGEAASAGYTHLISSAKSNADVARRLELRIKKDFPESYERTYCLQAS
jgi:hypothetical protein